MESSLVIEFYEISVRKMMLLCFAHFKPNALLPVCGQREFYVHDVSGYCIILYQLCIKLRSDVEQPLTEGQ